MGTSGGTGMTGGGRRRLAWGLAAAFLALFAIVTIGNAQSTISDLAAAGVREPPTHVWIWQVTSAVAWLSVMPLLWRAVAALRPPRTSWLVALAAACVGLVLASGWHVGVMIALRHLVYALHGETYRFEGSIARPYVYEFRKDVGTYLQLVALATGAQWLLARSETPTGTVSHPGLNASASASITVSDGTRRHIVPVAAIEHASAAGNYVELHGKGIALLHRTTLTGLAQQLGDSFVRIHRARLVNRTLVRRIVTDRSGDFTVELASGTVLGGSRRYRAQLRYEDPEGESPASN